MVYPESAGSVAPAPAQADEDRTSITSQNEISQLVGKMDGQRGHGSDDDEHLATQIASGDLDKLRALQALQAELGDPSDMDGTVEIQNPMKLWQEVQAAQAAARGAAEQAYDQSSDELDLRTEVADPSRFPRPGRGRSSDGSGLVEQSDPTFTMPQNSVPARPRGADAFGDSSPGVDPAGLGSGMHPYAQNTPPGGRASGPGGFPGNQNGGAQPPPFNRPQTASGLHSAQLFEDSEAEATVLQSHDPNDFANAVPKQPTGVVPDVQHGGPWKLRTGFGLTYEFPDTRSLRTWLSSREELDGYMVSADDGGNFFGLDQFPQLDRSSGRPLMPSGNFSVPASHGSGLNQQPPSFGDASASSSGLGRAPQQPALPAHQSGLRHQASAPANPTARGPLVNTDYQPPSQETQYRGLLWGLFFLLLLIAVGIALQTFGIYDIAGLVKGPESTVQPTTPGVTPLAPTATDPEALAKRQQAETEQLIKDARREIEGNKLQSALDKLTTTVAVSPENAEAWELLADVHARLGQASESEKAEAKAKELRSAEAPEASPDAGQPSE